VTARRAAVWFALLARAANVFAQEPTGAAGDRCAVTQSPLPAPLASAIAPGAPVALVARGAGAFVAFLDRRGALRLARTTDALAPLAEPRELTARGAAFSMTPSRDGVAVAWVEDQRALLLGLVDDGNELQNVPRLLSATRSTIARVLVTRAGEDFAAVWSTGGQAEVYAVRTDALAIPRGGAQGMGAGELFDLAWLPDRAELALNVAQADARWVVNLDARGREVTRTPWPRGARGPVTVDGSAMMVQLTAAGAPQLSRLAAEGTTAGATPPGLSLDALESRGGRVFALLHDARGERATLHRMDASGATLPPVSLRAQLAGPEAITVRDSGEVIAVLREGRRLLVARVRCPR
jgi:hypothetical protein